jgi:SAM-dependent methyltransferase
MKITELVRKSWNKIGKTYDTYRDHSKMNQELERFSSYLPERGLVLDVGSGSGLPVAKFLVTKGFQVKGLDISEEMVKLATKNVPEAEFIQEDLLEAEFSKERFNGIICVYTLWHIPRDTHLTIYQKFYDWLQPDGILMINTGARESEGMSLFFGEPMLWSNPSKEQTLKYIKQTGFEILSQEILSRGGEIQFWVFARKK